MNSNGSHRPIRPIVPATSPPPGVTGAMPVLSRSSWDTLHVAAMLHTSSLRLAEVYAASGHPGGTLAERVEARRRDYRAHLANTVVRASPLMLDTASPEEVVQALREMTPPHSWGPGRSIATGWFVPWRSPERVLNGVKNLRSYPIGSRTDVDAAFKRPFRVEGHVLRSPSHPLGGLGIRPVGDRLEIMLLIRGALIVSWRGLVRVTLPSPVPETVAIAARGRLLGELIDSPIFVDRDYRICDVNVKGGLSIFTATARCVSYEVPKIRNGKTDPL